MGEYSEKKDCSRHECVKEVARQTAETKSFSPPNIPFGATEGELSLVLSAEIEEDLRQKPAKIFKDGAEDGTFKDALVTDQSYKNLVVSFKMVDSLRGQRTITVTGANSDVNTQAGKYFEIR
jgi:hypothetical protein